MAKNRVSQGWRTLGKGKKRSFPGDEDPGKWPKTKFPRGWDTAGRPRRRRLVHPSAAWEPREVHKSGFPGGLPPTPRTG